MEISRLENGCLYVLKCDKFNVRGIFSAIENGKIVLNDAVVFLSDNEKVDFIAHDIFALNERIIKEIDQI